MLRIRFGMALGLFERESSVKQLGGPVELRTQRGFCLRSALLAQSRLLVRRLRQVIEVAAIGKLLLK